MQILESTVIGLRSARLSLKSRQSEVQITLFPMVHVGEPAFFRAVYDDAFSHDVVLVEGVRSPVTRRVTRSYRWIEKSKTLGLVVQPRYPAPSECHAKIVHADLSKEEFGRVWAKIPLWVRLLVYILSPLIGAKRRWFGSRESLANNLSLDDMADPKEILDTSPETIALTRAIVEARDERLIERLREQVNAGADAKVRIAVLYGGIHIRAVLRELTRNCGYRPDGARWLTIFSL